MIKPTRAFVASDGSTHAKLEDAQTRELAILFLPTNEALDESATATEPSFSLSEMADMILKERDKVLDILTTSSRSRPATRKINGASRKPRATPAKPAAP